MFQTQTLGIQARSHRAFPASDPSFFWRSLSAIFHSHPPSHLSVTWKMPHFAQTQFQRFHFYQRVPVSAFISIRYLFTFKVTAKKFKDRRLIQCLNLSTAKSRSWSWNPRSKLTCRLSNFYKQNSSNCRGKKNLKGHFYSLSQPVPAIFMNNCWVCTRK